MRGPRSGVKRAWLGGLACAGVAAAHWIAYLVAPPGGHSHAAGMDATGHRLWPYFVALAAGAFVAAMSGFVSDRVGTAPSASGSALWRHAAARLVPMQVLAFAGLELAERAFFADPGHTGLLGEPVLWVGIAVQILFALVGAGLLVLFAHTIELIQQLVARRSETAPAPRSLIQPAASRRSIRPLVMATGGPTFRGPPVLL